MYTGPGRFYIKTMIFMSDPSHNVGLSKRDWNCCFTLLRSTKENAGLILRWVSCVTQPENIEIFSVVDASLAPHPPPPKFFAGAYARPETVMDFGRAFMTPRSQTVNDKHTSAGEIYGLDGFWLTYFVTFFEFLRKVFEFISTRHSLKFTYKHKQRS